MTVTAAQFAALPTWLWDRLPLVSLFAGAWLSYRLAASTGLADVAARRLLGSGGAGTRMLLLRLIAASAGLSLLIPNAVTVLTLLPLVKLLSEDYERSGVDRREAVTALTLCLVYGANIGGLGSLIGSPANLLFVGALDFLGVAGRRAVGFGSWLAWGVPLAAAMVLAAWPVAYYMGAGTAMRAVRVRHGALQAEHLPETGPAARLFAGYLGFWLVESAWSALASPPRAVENAVCLGFLALFLWLACLRRLPATARPLLPASRLFGGLPLRGLGLLVLVTGLMLLAGQLDLGEIAARSLEAALPSDAPSFVILFALTLTAILLTEILSNSLVAAAFFIVAWHLGGSAGIPPIYPMLAVSLASTCAFMTPIATPANALAVGEAQGFRLWVMLRAGFVLNLLGAGLITAWLEWIVPLVW